LLIPVICLALLGAACSSDNGTSGSAANSASSSGSAELTVFAASSLTAAFTQIGKDFEAANLGTTVTFNYGPSDGLAGQIESEGTADVFASASPTWMDDVQKKVGVTGRADFAQNRLVIITPPDNPAHIATMQDLANPGVQLILAAKGVPVGDYAREALGNAGIAKQAEANVVSNEEDDASVVAKITSGEADAAIVYVSDVTDQVAPQVKAIQIPDTINVIATYPIAVVTGSSNADAAQAFVDYVTGTEGQATLKTYGFLPPPGTM
jgi:molybdate transport system substrate-binding protein